jgi:hypothetical protein
MSEVDTKRNITALLFVAVVVGITAIATGTSSQEDAKAQTSTSNMTGGQNQTNMMIMGHNITGSIPLESTIAKAIASQVHISLANASTTAEKAVGANAHSIAVRIGIVHGFLVYMALVHDMNSGTFHGVLVDPGSGKVLASTPIPSAAIGMMMGSGGMMGMMMGPGMGMAQNGMMKEHGMMTSHP